MPGVKAREQSVRVAGKVLELSHLDKILYPDADFSKAQVLDYYRRVAPALLPHLRDRALTMKRFPDGVTGEYFFEKQCPRFRPEWVKTVRVVSTGGKRDIVNHCLVQNLPSLMWVANLASLELHTSLARATAFDKPTMMVFDLDPGAPADIHDCARVALELRRVCGRSKLKAFPKTSGGKGLQIYVPLNTPTTYDATKGFALAAAQVLEGRIDGVTSNMSKARRRGNVFIDWSQNSKHKTTVCVYSLRAQPEPTVSTPVTWKEVRRAAKQRRGSGGLRFTADQVLARVERKGDLFKPVLTLKQRLPK